MKKNLIISVLLCIILLTGCSTSTTSTKQNDSTIPETSTVETLTVETDEPKVTVIPNPQETEEVKVEQEEPTSVEIGAARSILFIKNGLLSPNEMIIKKIYVIEETDYYLYCIEYQYDTLFDEVAFYETYLKTDLDGKVIYDENYEYVDDVSREIQPIYYDSKVKSYNLEIERINYVLDDLK